MKVCLINASDKQGGAAVACNRLHKSLIDSKIDASFLVQKKQSLEPKIESTTNGRLKNWLNFYRFAAERLSYYFHEPTKEYRFLFSPATFGENISRHSAIQQADILHLHWINQGFLALSNIRQLVDLQKPIVWTLHDMWAFTGGCHYAGTCRKYQTKCHTCPLIKRPHKHDLSAKRWQAKLAMLNRANITFVTCSKWLAGEARQSSLLKNFRIESIPNPIDLNLFKPENQAITRRKLNLPLSKKIILFGAANVQDKRKGLKYFLRAMQLLAQNIPQAKQEIALLVFGKNESDFEKQLPFPVFSLSYISDIQTIVSVYNAADVFVLPSLEDNLPNTIMEALACGVPSVAFNTGGIPEMIAHKKTGYLSDYQSSEDLAKGIEQVLFRSNAKLLRRHARQKAVDSYSFKEIANQYGELYRSLL